MILLDWEFWNLHRLLVIKHCNYLQPLKILIYSDGKGQKYVETKIYFVTFHLCMYTVFMLKSLTSSVLRSHHFSSKSRMRGRKFNKCEISDITDPARVLKSIISSWNWSVHSLSVKIHNPQTAILYFLTAYCHRNIPLFHALDMGKIIFTENCSCIPQSYLELYPLHYNIYLRYVICFVSPRTGLPPCTIPL